MNKLWPMIVGVIVILVGTFFVASNSYGAPFPYAVGGTGTTTASVGQLLYGGPTAYQSVATTSVSCGTGASCTSFTAIGSSAVTITATGNPAFIATSSSETSGYVPFWTSTNATPATLSGGVANFAWNNTDFRLTATYASSTAITGTSLFGTNATITNGTITFASSTAATANTLYAQDKQNTGWGAQLVSPTHTLVLQTGTTTTFTSTTTGAYVPAALAPFGGTIRQARCLASSTQSFVGVTIFVNTTKITPSYFVASTTSGVITFTANNTFVAGDRISMIVGTSTSDSNQIYTTCSIDTTQS